MQLLHILRGEEPLCRDWFISSYNGRKNCFDIYTVKNRVGFEADMKVIVLPKDKNADRYFGILDSVRELGSKNDCFLKLFGYNSVRAESGQLVIYAIYEKAEDVRSIFEKTRLISKMITELAQDVAGVLKDCEKSGIYHGGISLDTVYISGNKYKLGNFGESELLAEAGLSGTDNPDYFSAPEKKKDIRSDLYSLGLIIYSLYNFDRLPFVPTKDERYFLPEDADETAYKKRMTASENRFPNPLYADAVVIELINKCCEFNPEERYASVDKLIEKLEDAKNSINLNRVVEYPNFSSLRAKRDQEETDMYEEEEIDISENVTKGNDISPTPKSQAQEDNGFYTMGAQEMYNAAMRSIRSNRHIHIDESVLQDIEKTERRIAEKYGVDSAHYRKFIEKVRSLENLKDDVERLKKDNAKRSVIIKILICVAAVAVVIGVIFALNTNTFYINQGQYHRIYRKNLFGTVECFKSVSCNGLLKDKNRLYYIKSEDNKIYSTSAKNGADEVLIADDAASAFKIVDEYIYYINLSDGQKLYRVDTDGNNREAISNEACISISVDKKNIVFINASDPSSPKLYDTESETIKDEYIN